MMEFWQDRPVFVTGATGLLGSWLIPALIRRGANVVALVRDSVPRSLLVRDGWLDRIVSVRGELTDEKLIRRALVEYSVDTIFHLGAQSQVGVAKADPVGTLETNVRGTWTVLEAARQSGVGQVLVASSDRAAAGLAQDESCGQFPYEVSKSCADLITKMYATTFGVPAATVYCGNFFGGGDLNFQRLIPGVIRTTLRGEPFLIRSDGKFVRDFLYVEDGVAAYLHLAECLAADPSLRGESFYFGMESRLTVLELTERVLELMGRSDLRPIVQNTVKHEVRKQQRPDTARTKLRLGWLPQYGVEEGLRRSIAWYTEFFASEPAVAECAYSASHA